MSDQALQQVIEELKARGLRAGEEEGSKIVTSADEKAKTIVANANDEASRIIDNAKKEAESMRTQLAAELRQASAVGLEAFRQTVEKSFLVPTVDASVKAVLDDTEALKDVIVSAAKGFADSDEAAGDLTVILPEAQQAALEGAFVAQLKAGAGKGVTVSFADGFDFGFRIAPGDSGYVFDFSEDGFREIFVGFLAPRFRKYFFQS
ncbi:MAG: hypothetical protein HN348_08025 [Proteobacteria bacterium]|jgi:V/A-type H+/Na+-transporting ATPase subunit E|nr:hypothetical protein [Pseudomonadota bacterium]